MSDPSACRPWALHGDTSDGAAARLSWGRPAAGSRAVFGLSRDHELLAFSRESRTLAWRRRLPGGGGVTQGSEVFVAGDLVIAGDGGVFAVAAATGARRWHLAGDSDADEAGRSPGRFLAADPSGGRSDVLWAGSASGVMTALDVMTGRVRWRSSIGSERTTVFAPVFGGGLVAAAFTDFGASPRAGGVVAVGADTGIVRWTTRFSPRAPPLPASAAGPVLLVGDLVVAAASDGVVYALDQRDGRVRWTLPPADHGGLPPHEDFRAMAFVPPVLVVGSLGGVLAGYDVTASVPEERWRFVSPPDGSIAFDVVADGGAVYVPFASGRLIAFSAADGRPRQVLGGASLRFEWPPAVDGVSGGGGRQLLLASEEGLYGCAIDEP